MKSSLSLTLGLFRPTSLAASILAASIINQVALAQHVTVSNGSTVTIPSETYPNPLNVTASNGSTILGENAVINGAVTASGTSTISLQGGSITRTTSTVSVATKATVSIDGVTINAGKVATTENVYANGVAVRSGGSFSSLNSTINATGRAMLSEQRAAVDVMDLGSTGSIVGSSLVSTGDYYHGAFVNNGATVTINSSSISTNGSVAAGVYTYTLNAAATASITNTSILTSGTSGYGVYSASSGDALAVGNITGNGLTIETTGYSGYGAYVRVAGKMDLENSSIVTHGTAGYGVRVAPLVQAGAGKAEINLTNVAIETHGQSGHGARIDQAGIFNITNSSVVTNFTGAAGLHFGSDVEINVTNSTIRSQGNGMSAVFDAAGYDLPKTNLTSTVTLSGTGTDVRSENGDLLVITRSADTSEGEQGSLVLNIVNGANAVGNISDTGVKTTGVLTINVGLGSSLTSNVITGFDTLNVDGALYGTDTLNIVANTVVSGSGIISRNVSVDGGTLSKDLIIRGTVDLANKEHVSDVTGNTSVADGTELVVSGSITGATVDASAGTASVSTLGSGGTLVAGNWGANVENFDGGTITGTSSGVTVTVTNVNAGTVESGLLRVENDGTGTASGQVLNVGAGGTLAGNGAVAADTTVSGALNPGNSPGQLDFLGDLVLESEAVVNLELGQTYDSITVGGSLLHYDGTLNITFTESLELEEGQTFNLFVFGSGTSVSGAFDAINILDPYQFGYNGVFDEATGNFTVTVIPEPGTNLLLLLGGVGAILAFRRRAGAA